MLYLFSWIKREEDRKSKRKADESVSWQTPVVITPRTPATEHLFAHTAHMAKRDAEQRLR